VNVVLAPILYALVQMSRSAGLADSSPDVYIFLQSVFIIDVRLLLFNILPIYPLDGGQILRSLLWFVMSRAQSLLVATVIGILGIICFIGFAIKSQQVWLGLISIYLLFICWSGLQQARQLLRVAKLPRRSGFGCPSCRTAPPIGAYWQCGACKQPFDTFETRAICPHCATRFETTRCLDCGELHPMSEWVVGSLAGVGSVNGGYPAQ